MNKLRRTRLSLAGVILIVMVSVLSACEDAKPTTPTPIQATAQPTTAQPTSVSSPPTEVAPTQEATAISVQPTSPPVTGNDPAAIFQAGTDALNAGNYDQAIEAFTAVIEAAPDYGPAYYRRGVAYASKNDPDKALDDLNTASGLLPEDPQPVLLGGIILHQAGRSDDALNVFSYAIQLDSNLPDGYYWRATVLLAQNLVADALDDLGRVVSLAPNSDMGKQAAAAIEQINGGGQVTPIEPAPLPTPEQSQPPQPEQPVATPPVLEGQTVADLGFRPEKDGFQFQNWGFDPNRLDLTTNDVRRMFGDQVCASIQGQDCILTPAGTAWLDETNQGIRGGHCEGFAALSLIFYQGKQDPASFGSAVTHDLTIDDNSALQREIAYYWTTQTVRPTNNARTPRTPSEVIDILSESFKGGQQTLQTYTIAFWKPGFRDGHAVTPYAIQDLGGGKYALKVYDNNHPGVERIMNLDRNANTWSYNAATNPSEPDSAYEGDASTQTFMLTPTDVRLQQQTCPFCRQGGGARPPGVSQAEQQFNAIYLEGTGHLLITDAEGRHTGFLADDKFVNEIPGADFEPIVSSNLYKDSREPIYYIPTGIEFTVEVVSTNPTENTISTVSMIGPGYVLSVQDIVLQPGESDAIDFSEDGTTVTYRTQYTDSPDILLGTETAGADYAFLVKGVELGNGGTVKVYLDQGTLAIDTIDNTEPATYGLVMYRIDDQGEQLFAHDSINLLPNDIAHLDYADWKGNGDTLALKIDHEGDGTDDESVELTDVR